MGRPASTSSGPTKRIRSSPDPSVLISRDDALLSWFQRTIKVQREEVRMGRGTQEIYGVCTDDLGGV